MNWKKACYLVWTVCGVLLVVVLAGVLMEKSVSPAVAQTSQVIMPREPGSYQISCTQILQGLDGNDYGDYDVDYTIRCYRVDTVTGHIVGQTVF